MQPGKVLGSEGGVESGQPTLQFAHTLKPEGSVIRTRPTRVPCVRMGRTDAERDEEREQLRGKLAIADVTGEPAMITLGDRTIPIARRLEEIDREPALPVYYVYPMPEWTEEVAPGQYQEFILEVNPGPAFVRVKPRGGNPNVFIRRDDPLAAMAEVIDGTAG